ncbi:MAG: hypothetical protein ACOCVG_04410 [Verrucomicrobiota bacterium]
METPAIVIPCYQRPGSLRRLLDSLLRADYGERSEVPLVLSLEGEATSEVREVARALNWPHGKKRLIEHRARKGLAQHILSCGDLTEEYGSVIILEDDLLAARPFYRWACEALTFYANEPQVGGISLWSPNRSETAFRGFTPMADGYDNFFAQFPSSWGQAWTRDQWRAFRRWLMSRGEQTATDPRVPPIVRGWPEDSWKKGFCAYQVDRQRYFVFPRISQTALFGELGAHHLGENLRHRPSLALTWATPRLARLDQSEAIYDACLQPLPGTLKAWQPHLRDYDFEVDLNGDKDAAAIKAPYCLTCRAPTDSICSFGAALVPDEMNIIHAIPGNAFGLCPTSQRLPEIPAAERLRRMRAGEMLPFARGLLSLEVRAWFERFGNGSKS